MKSGEVSEVMITAQNKQTWDEFQNVATREHPDPLPGWNFNKSFPDFPNRYRRSDIKNVIGKARDDLTAHLNMQHTRKKKSHPGYPHAPNHPTHSHCTYRRALA